MGCLATPNQCRARDIAPRLFGTESNGTDWEARCPTCNHGGFRISAPNRSRYRNIWTCACKICRCDKADMRSSLLALGIMPACLGEYGSRFRSAVDPVAAQRLEQAARDIIAAPGLKPSDMRIVLAEALGEKAPADQRSFVPWAMGIGIGRRQAYEAAGRWCRPAVESSLPGGVVTDV